MQNKLKPMIASFYMNTSFLISFLAKPTFRDSFVPNFITVRRIHNWQLRKSTGKIIKDVQIYKNACYAGNC